MSGGKSRSGADFDATSGGSSHKTPREWKRYVMDKRRICSTLANLPKGCGGSFRRRVTRLGAPSAPARAVTATVTWGPVGRTGAMRRHRRRLRGRHWPATCVWSACPRRVSAATSGALKTAVTRCSRATANVTPASSAVFQARRCRHSPRAPAQRQTCCSAAMADRLAMTTGSLRFRSTEIHITKLY